MKLSAPIYALLGSLLLPTGSPAQVPEARFQQAIGTVQLYAQDMSKVIPCLYVALTGPNPNMDMVDSNWGESAVKQTLEEFRFSGASPEQEQVLRQAFHRNYHPVWSVSDVRKFGRACYPVILQAQMFSGEAAPLKLRPPFSSNK